MKIEIIQHYQEDDPDYISDYVDVEVFVDGDLIREYADGYHDNGDIKAEAFVEGIKWAISRELPEMSVQVRRVDVADREAW